MLNITLTDTTNVHRPTLTLSAQNARITRNMLVISGLAGSYVPTPDDTDLPDRQSREGERIAHDLQATMHDIHREVGQIQVSLPDWSADIA